MSEREIFEIFGKSIWDMTPAELVKNGLVEVWARLVDKNAG